MSLETRLAHHDHAQAARELKAHKHACVTCERAARYRKPGEMCAEGLMLREAEMTLADAAREADRLDAAPSPDQEPLW